MDTVDRNCIWNEYMQQVILISQVNHVYAGSGGFEVWGEGLSPGHWDHRFKSHFRQCRQWYPWQKCHCARTPSITVRQHSRLRLVHTIRRKSMLYSVTIMPLKLRKILLLNCSLQMSDINQNKQLNISMRKFSDSKWC